MHLFDAMIDGELREAGIDQDQSGWRDRLPIPRLDETTFVRRIFGGYFRSQVQCTRCNYKSNTYDPFLDLSLQISKKSCNSVFDSLRDFTRKEQLDSENQWKCSGCNKHVCATKQLTVFRPPLVLCVQLKRFSFSGAFQRRKKISKPVEFPALLKLPLSDGRSCRYSLTGVVMHLGCSAHLGHYTACVKKPGKDGRPAWYLMDDSFAEPISEKAVLRQNNAYMLFYCRDEVKIEYPSPPLRSSMSAEEAQECSRMRSRAKSHKYPDSVDHPSEKDDIGEKSRNKSSAPLAGKKNVATEEKNRDSLEKASEQTPTNSHERSNSSESSSDSSESDSTNSDTAHEDRVDCENKSQKEKPEKGTGQTLADLATPVQLNAAGIDAETVHPGEIKKSVESREESSDNSSSGDDSASARSSSSSSGNESLDNPKPAKVEEAKYPEESDLGNQTSRTKISLDRGEGKGKVSLMFGPRFKGRGWIPGSNNTPKGRDYDLLGNVAVGKWGEEEEDNEARETALGTERQRAALADSITKSEKMRKKRMYVDGWDAALDRGKTKKVKGEAEQVRPSESQNIRFQKIQASVQRMNRGRAKGRFRQDGGDRRKGRR